MFLYFLKREKCDLQLSWPKFFHLKHFWIKNQGLKNDLKWSILEKSTMPKKSTFAKTLNSWFLWTSTFFHDQIKIIYTQNDEDHPLVGSLGASDALILHWLVQKVNSWSDDFPMEFLHENWYAYSLYHIETNRNKNDQKIWSYGLWNQNPNFRSSVQSSLALHPYQSQFLWFFGILDFERM